MKINRQNYELYAADFLDGKLSPSDTAEFMAFLAENNDIADEIDLIRQLEPNIEPDNSKTDFSFLKKDLNQIKICDKNFEEMCIAFYEGDLNDNSKKKLVEFISNDSVKKQKFNIYGQLKIQADKTIVYNKKTELKHGYTRYIDTRRLALITSFATAASIALFLFLRQPETNQYEHYVNEINEQNIEKTESLTQMNIDQETETVRTESTNKVENNSKGLKTVHIPFKNKKTIAAVSDSIDKEQDDFIQISFIEPKIIEPEIVLDSAELFNSSDLYALTSKNKEKPLEEIKEKTSTILALAGNLTVNDVIKGGINGINKMVEADLDYKSTTDREGKIKEFALSSESFNIRRKIKSN